MTSDRLNEACSSGQWFSAPTTRLAVTGAWEGPVGNPVSER
jgi:hypothetical protein